MEYVGRGKSHHNSETPDRSERERPLQVSRTLDERNPDRNEPAHEGDE